MQFFTSLMVLAASMALTNAPEAQTNVVNIILGNVALSFILDLDNRVGAILTAQGRPSRVEGAAGGVKHDIAAGGRQVGSTTGKQRCHAVAFGYVYMAVIGLLLFVELMCWSPTLIGSIYRHAHKDGAPELLTSWAGSYVPLTCRLQPLDAGVQEVQKQGRLWYLYTHRQSLAGDLSVVSELYSNMRRLWGPTSYQHSLDFKLLVLFPCATALFVVLLFSNMLPPTEAKRFAPVLLAVQVCVAVLMCINVWRYLFLRDSCLTLPVMCSPVIAAWLGMFVLWPLCHKPQAMQCRGCSCCCRSCGGCPLPACSNLCPGRCCCECTV